MFRYKDRASRAKVIRPFTIGGLVLGLLYGLYLVISDHMAPVSDYMLPPIARDSGGLLFRIYVVGIMTGVSGGFGFVLGCAVSLFQRRG